MRKNRVLGAASLVIVLTVGMLIGCDTDPALEIDQQWTSLQERRGDTLLVRTTGGSIWRDTVALVRELSIGVLDGEDAYLLGAVGGLDVDSGGHMYVVDRQAKNVRVFSAEGVHIRTIGRGGEGPGEFLRPDCVRATSDGRIIVRDAPWRFSVFSSEGEYRGGWPILSGFGTSTAFFLDAQGRVLNPTLPDTLVRYTVDGLVVDTVPEPSRGYAPPRLEVTMENGRASYSIPFLPSEKWTVTRDGRFLFGLTREYRIDRWEPNGPVLRIERVVDPVPVQSGEAAQARESVTRSIRSSNNPSWSWQGPEIPSHKPPWLSVFGGLDGSIWVLRSTVAVEEDNQEWDPERPERGSPTRWMGPRVADVFDAGGSYLGPVKIPEEMSLYPTPVLSAEAVWAVSTHELGFQQVVRYRLSPHGDSPADQAMSPG